MCQKFVYLVFYVLSFKSFICRRHGVALMFPSLSVVGSLSLSSSSEKSVSFSYLGSKFACRQWFLTFLSDFLFWNRCVGGG